MLLLLFGDLGRDDGCGYHDNVALLVQVPPGAASTAASTAVGDKATGSDEAAQSGPTPAVDGSSAEADMPADVPADVLAGAPLEPALAGG